MVRRLAILSATLLAAAFVLVPTVAAGDPCFHELDNRPPTSSGSTSQVAIGDCVFVPTVSRVPVGTTVTWRNGSIQEHEVVGSNMTWGAHKKMLFPGDSIGWTFNKPGVYAYSCMVHPGMTGAIIVGDAASAETADGTTGGAGTVTETTPKDTGAGGIVAPLAVGGSLIAIAGLGFLVLRRRAAESQA